MLDIIFSFGLSFLLLFALMPFVIKTAIYRGIIDSSDERKAHSGVVPSSGGVGIFISFAFVSLLTIPADQLGAIRYIPSSLVVIFLLGAQDDLSPLRSFAKLLGQSIVVFILIVFADIRIIQLHGLFGIDALPYVINIVLSILFYLFVINSYNLIDGINGLCFSVVILITSLLGCWFFLVSYYEYCTLAFVVCGATLALLMYNIITATIFTGDTGSLVLGAVCSIIVIQFLDINSTIASDSMRFESPVIVVTGLMILPIYDTLRVFAIRMLEGTSPFVANKRNLHHLILEAGLSHMQAILTLLGSNVFMIVFAIQLAEIQIVFGFILMIFVSIIFTQIIRLIIVSKPSVASSS